MDGQARYRTVPWTGRRTMVDLRRAVIELAIVRGWRTPGEVAAIAALPGLVLSAPTTMLVDPGWPDLTLIRRLDRRLVFAALTSDDTTALSPRKRLVLDLLSAIGWSSDERRRVEEVLGHTVPSIEAFIWCPADLAAGTIDEVLR